MDCNINKLETRGSEGLLFITLVHIFKSQDSQTTLKAAKIQNKKLSLMKQVDVEVKYSKITNFIRQGRYNISY